MNITDQCTNCGSTMLTWHLGVTSKSGIADGRLRTVDMTPFLYLGCEECSETLDFIWDDIALAELHKNQRVDPRLLRWCDWPQCLRSYDANTGPVGDPGWMRHKMVTERLLCPEHHAANHHPSCKWTPGNDFITAICSCGESEDVRPSNGEAAQAWWSAHVSQLPSGIANALQFVQMRAESNDPSWWAQPILDLISELTKKATPHD